MIKSLNKFDKQIETTGKTLNRLAPEILQINVGKLCNLTCSHCHVNAGPNRKEIITGETIDKILPWFEKSNIPTLDMTGGTPEMIPDFKRLVKAVRSYDKPRKIIDRLNATIISEPEYEWVPDFLADNKIEIVASMPCYTPDNVNEQRGDGVFDRSITAFQKLNELGYGKDPELVLNFVYNPIGPKLPPEQKELENDYKVAMKDNFGIEFNDLFCITNMPISRYASYLKRHNQLEEYQQLLINSFNPGTVDSLMCRNTINISWEGDVFDCDFNQMLGLTLAEATNKNLKVWDINLDSFQEIPIRTADHCFACTAGSGSSCGGSLSS